MCCQYVPEWLHGNKAISPQLRQSYATRPQEYLLETGLYKKSPHDAGFVGCILSADSVEVDRVAELLIGRNIPDRRGGGGIHTISR